MNWDLELARAAQRALREMPARDRERINRVLNDIKTDPLSSDITALRGAYRGLYCRRVGSWRHKDTKDKNQHQYPDQENYGP
jgi:Txe/YoeB family toxin of Txe-Axe toxin-antitoxin module